jgi:hypothetical protein
MRIWEISTPPTHLHAVSEVFRTVCNWWFANNLKTRIRIYNGANINHRLCYNPKFFLLHDITPLIARPCKISDPWMEGLQERGVFVFTKLTRWGWMTIWIICRLRSKQLELIAVNVNWMTVGSLWFVGLLFWAWKEKKKQNFSNLKSNLCWMKNTSWRKLLQNNWSF